MYLSMGSAMDQPKLDELALWLPTKVARAAGKKTTQKLEQTKGKNMVQLDFTKFEMWIAIIHAHCWFGEKNNRFRISHDISQRKIAFVHPGKVKVERGSFFVTIYRKENS